MLRNTSVTHPMQNCFFKYNNNGQDATLLQNGFSHVSSEIKANGMMSYFAVSSCNSLDLDENCLQHCDDNINMLPRIPTTFSLLRNILSLILFTTARLKWTLLMARFTWMFVHRDQRLSCSLNKGGYVIIFSSFGAANRNRFDLVPNLRKVK
jgi:hypothetical protein